MLREMLEDAIGRKVDKETFKLASDMTTQDIKFHSIDFLSRVTKIDYVMVKLIESVSIVERMLCEEIKKDSPKTV
ncbi:hypothetical protein [Clostridium cylindrosporum]|uniref:Uncharacterized protein n=1 Tax=Clostridium cylindrosporum DSM 605 TaxID=1121307 RepID=A0A0J8G1E0_CLOCY|nr:hypothetical protein [Clostridium cylindrosporum]KMT21571.1 hypothetical protein CLCY_2c03330 [Clostridium cylindrosporum DSM 605]